MRNYPFTRRLLTGLCCLVFLACAVGAPCSAAAKKHILVISVTKGHHHSTIPLGEEIIKDLGDKSGLWKTTYARTDEELQKLTTAEALKSFDLVFFNNTSGDIPLADRQVFINWVKAGGNVAGIHGATDTFHAWPEFVDMMGGEFIGHGNQSEVEFLIQDPKHPATKDLPRSFSAAEEVYRFGRFSRYKVRVLVALDRHPNTYKPGFYPVSWVRMYGKGRVFYTSIGHREDLLGSDPVQKHILGGMRWALGLAPGESRPLPSTTPVSRVGKQVLVISVTKTFRHAAIPLGEEIVANLGYQSGLWRTTYARTDEELQSLTTAEALKRFDALLFNNTTGDLPLADRQAFLDWVKAGGNVVGIHAATDTFHTWPEYIDLIGGEFADHSRKLEVEFLVQDAQHPATKDIPSRFKAVEEVYEFKNFHPDRVRVLLALDKHPTTSLPGFYPMSWVRMYGKGRVFYTALGHVDQVLLSDVFQKHVLGGMRWALGLAPGDAEPLSPPPPPSDAEKAEGFRAIFNGKDLTGWHPRADVQKPWTVQNGMLVIGSEGTDLISDEKFRDFILRYEYMLPKDGNSGVYLRGRYEIQAVDDTGGKKNEPTPHGNGSIYGKIAPKYFVSRPTGEWQSVEAKIIENRVTVILNGVTIFQDQPIDSPTMEPLDDKVDEPGPIRLQGDHGPVAYRNIRIKPL